MEITVQVLNLSIIPSHEASVNLHCTVQTASDKFVKSSLLNLDKSSKPVDDETLPVFKYTFRRPYLESAVTFLLSCLKDGNTHQEDLGVAFTPLELDSKPTIRDAILKLKMKDAPLYVNTGRVSYRISYSLTQGTEVGKPSYKQWVGLSSARLNLPLLNDPECGWMGSKSEVEETGDFLKMREAEQKHLNGVLMPGKDPKLTVIFHSFATSWNIDKFTPFTCLIKGEVLSTSPDPPGPAIPGPSAQWFWNETHKTGSLTACDIFKVIDFKIKSPSFQSASLYLFEESICGPIVHITEPIYSLAPFRFYHRGWLPNIPQPTIPSDSCVHDSIHILTSIHMMPAEQDYESYQGFELIVTDVSYEDLSEDTWMVFGIELIRKSQSENIATSHSHGFVPPFFEKRGSDHTHRRGHGGGDNFKVSFYIPPEISASTDDQVCKAYFFFPENEEILTRDIRNKNMPTFIFHACIIDKTDSSLPWWVASHHYQASLEIDLASFNLLLNHKGVKWFNSWDGAEKSSSCSLEVALRWKNANCRFLSPNDSQEMAEQQYLQVLLHHFSLKNQQQATHELVDNAVADIMRQNPAAAPLSMTALTNLTETLQQQLHNPDTTSELSLDERTYRQTIQELGAVVLKVQQEKEVLEKDNARLSDELTVLKAKQQETVQSATLGHAIPDSALLNKITLLEKELDDQKAEVNLYREEAQILQNELEKKDYELKITRISHHEQVKNLHRKVNKYQRCYKMAIQQDRILTELENLIAQLPAKERNGNNQNNAENTGNQEVDRTGRESSTSGNDSSIGDDEISPEPHLQQAVNAMGNEISRLRQENDLLHSHLSSIIKAMDINNRKQRKSHQQLSPLIDRCNKDDGSNNNRRPAESKTNEQLTSF